MTITWGVDGSEVFVAVLDQGAGISPRMPPRRSSASGAARPGPPDAAERASALRSWARSPSAGAVPRRSRGAPRAAPARRSGCRPRPSGARARQSRDPTRGTVSGTMRVRLTAGILVLAGLLVAVAVGLAANSIASRSFTPGVDALPSAGSLAPPATNHRTARRRPPRRPRRRRGRSRSRSPSRSPRPPAPAPRPRHPTTSDASRRERQQRLRQGRAAAQGSSGGHGGGHGSDD